MEIKNYDKLVKKLNTIQKNEALEKGITKACLLVERSAKENLTGKSDTGNLKASITHEVIEENNDVVGIVGTNKFYAPFVEFGTGIFAFYNNGRTDVPWCYYDDEKNMFVRTSGQQPTLFLTNAYNTNVSKCKAIITKELHMKLGEICDD